MTALPNADRDAAKSELRRTQAQVNNLDAIPGGFPTSQAAQISKAAQRTLEREVRACSGEAIEFIEKQASSGKRGQFRPQRRKSAGDQIAVYEANDPSVFCQELARESGLTRSVGPAITMQRGDLGRGLLTWEKLPSV